MQTAQMLATLLADPTPAIQVQAGFEDDMKFSLRPVVFQKLTNIGSLFTEEKKPESYFKDKMLKKLKKSVYHGQVKLVTYIGV